MSESAVGESYHPIAKALHWIIFVLFTIMFILGFILMGSDGVKARGFDWGPIFDWHATIGLIVLVLAIIRIWFRARTPLPSWAPGLSAGERKLAHWTERIMYFVMIAKPVSGYIMAGAAGYNIDLFVQIRLGNPFGDSGVNSDGGLYDVALFVHIVTGIGFLIVWVIHVGQALRHQFVKKDHLLERMLPRLG